jgi:hypothetical protein
MDTMKPSHETLEDVKPKSLDNMAFDDAYQQKLTRSILFKLDTRYVRIQRLWSLDS